MRSAGWEYLAPTRDANLGDDAPLRLRGCAPSRDDLELRLQWASTLDDLSADASWNNLEDAGLSGQASWRLDWSAPDAANGTAVRLRAAGLAPGQSPDASTRWSYAPGRVVVAPSLTSSPPENGAPPFDACGVDVEPPSDTPRGCVVHQGDADLLPLLWILLPCAMRRRPRPGLRAPRPGRSSPR